MDVTKRPVEAETDPEKLRVEVIAIALNLVRSVLASPDEMSANDIERLAEAEDLLRRWLGKEPWSGEWPEEKAMPYEGLLRDSSKVTTEILLPSGKHVFKGGPDNAS